MALARSLVRSPLTLALTCACALGGAGCASSPLPSADAVGAPLAPDMAWRRKPVPLPPLFMDFQTGEGDRWRMVTPLYWRVDGPEGSVWHILPLAHHGRDAGGITRSGHVLTYFWGRDSGAEGAADAGYDVVFPLWWRFEDAEGETQVLGPLYTHHDKGPNGRSRTVLLPWIFSRETDDSGYSYWGVLFRLFGYERQVFADGVARSRLWLLFGLTIDLGEQGPEVQP